MPQRKKVLLSDHDESFCTLLRDALHIHGDFHVLLTHNGHDLMEAVHLHKPDVLVLDHRLPHKGGFPILEQLRDGGHKLSTILMTALPTHRVAAEAHALGVKSVLPKPFTAAALVERIHHILQGASDTPGAEEHNDFPPN